jgi:hypothetical protein
VLRVCWLCFSALLQQGVPDQDDPQAPQAGVHEAGAGAPVLASKRVCQVLVKWCSREMVTRSHFQMMGHLGWHAPDGLDAEFADKTS